MVETLEKTLTAAPAMRFHLNLSIDHTDEERHDYIRGKQGAWARMNETAEAIRPFRRRFPNLIVHTLTTVMKENQDDILAIYDELQRRFEPDGASFNYCRGHPLDPSQTELKPETYQALARRMEEDFRPGAECQRGDWRTAPGIPHPRSAGAPQRRTHGRGEPAPVLVRVGPASLRHLLRTATWSSARSTIRSLGNLRDVDYDFRRLWFSEQADEVAERAANGCFCTHECGHYALDDLQHSVGDEDQWAGRGGRDAARPSRASASLQKLSN